MPSAARPPRPPQAAGRNQYEQRYLEVTGEPGDLRISRVTSGDAGITETLRRWQRGLLADLALVAAQHERRLDV